MVVPSPLDDIVWDLSYPTAEHLTNIAKICYILVNGLCTQGMWIFRRLHYGQKRDWLGLEELWVKFRFSIFGATGSFSDEVLDQASRYGIGIIKQVGEGVEIEAKNLRAY